MQLDGSVIWTQVVGNGVYSASSIVDDRVYLTADPGFVYCLDVITGDVLWNYETNANYMDSSPAVVDGKVYVGAGSNDGHVYCLDASTGSEIWKYKTGDKIYSSPAYFNGKIYIGSYDKNMYCLDATTGSKIWSFTMEGSCFLSSPAYFNGKIYIGSYDKNMYCLDATTGSKIWSYTTGGKVDSSPAIADGKVFFGSYDQNVYCLDAITGSKIWSFKTNGSVYSSPAIADGKIFFGSFDNNFYCLDAVTGSIIWIYVADGDVSSSPAIADGALYIGGVVNGRIYCFKDKVSKAPSAPIITGESSGKPGIEYEYTFVSTDPEGDNIEYCIDWGDNTGEVCIGPYSSGAEASAKHTWSEQGDYTIKVKARDVNGAESDWETLDVSMPKSKSIININQGEITAEIGVGDEEEPRVYLDGNYRLRGRFAVVYGTATNGEKEVRFQGLFKRSYFILQIPLRGRIVNIIGRYTIDENRDFSGRWTIRGTEINGWIKGTIS